MGVQVNAAQPNTAQYGRIKYQGELTSAPSPVGPIMQMCPFCLEEEPQVQKDKKGGYWQPAGLSSLSPFAICKTQNVR